jgi:hypothetical protein
VRPPTTQPPHNTSHSSFTPTTPPPWGGHHSVGHASATIPQSAESKSQIRSMQQWLRRKSQFAVFRRIPSQISIAIRQSPKFLRGGSAGFLTTRAELDTVLAASAQHAAGARATTRQTVSKKLRWGVSRRLAARFWRCCKRRAGGREGCGRPQSALRQVRTGRLSEVTARVAPGQRSGSH